MVTLAKNAGFCFGVKRAAEMTEELLSEPGLRIYTLGDLIHNRLYIRSLAERGVRSINFDEVERIACSTETEGPAALVIRAHGIPREQIELLNSLSERYPAFRVYDMTCPNVKRIHKFLHLFRIEYRDLPRQMEEQEIKKPPCRNVICQIFA